LTPEQRRMVEGIASGPRGAGLRGPFKALLRSPELGDRVTDLKIVVEKGARANTFVLTANHNDVIGYWDLGNGVKVEAANTALAEYPFAGNYTVTLQGYSSGGKSNTVSAVIPVTKDNFELIDDPVYPLICGGINNPSGKTWIMDSAYYGHICNLNTTDPVKNGPNNRALPVNEPTKFTSNDLRMGSTMYNDEMTFFLTATKGPAFEYNTGDGKTLVTNTGSNAVKNAFMETSSWAPTAAVSAAGIALPAGFVDAYNSDWQVACTPPKGMTWLLIKAVDGSYTIKFPATASGPGGFMLFATDWSNDYTIKSISENRMVVWKKTSVNNSLRQLVFIKKGTSSGLPLTDEEVNNGVK
jgi:hypothetical protein